jgi:hypothetical protein
MPHLRRGAFFVACRALPLHNRPAGAAALDEGTAPAGVAPESVDAIDHVRSEGNIGANFEKDVNLIIDIDPGEAQALFELIETPFVDRYVARKERQDRFARAGKLYFAGADRVAEPKPNMEPEPFIVRGVRIDRIFPVIRSGN